MNPTNENAECPTCGAPASYTAAGSNHVVGDWHEEWTFDAQDWLAQRVAALTDAQTIEIAKMWGESPAIFTDAQVAERVRAALLTALGGAP